MWTAEPSTAVVGRPFEIQRDSNALVPLLREMLTEAGIADAVPHAVTMTAELSQLVRTKREGVRFVLDSIEAAFPGASVYVFTVDGRFLTPADARERPLSVAAANWAATARAVAVHHPDALLVDIGTTTNRPCPNRRWRSRRRRSHGSRAAGCLPNCSTRVQCARRRKRSPVTFRLGNGLAGVSAEGFGARRRCSRVARPIFVPPTTRVRLPTGAPPRARLRRRAPRARRLRRSRDAGRHGDHSRG